MNSKKIIKVLVITPFTLSWYIYKCWIVTSWWGPLACFIFFLIGSLVNNLTLPRVVRESQMVESREGDYRWQNARIRRHAENIALRKVFIRTLYLIGTSGMAARGSLGQYEWLWKPF